MERVLEGLYFRVQFSLKRRSHVSKLFKYLHVDRTDDEELMSEKDAAFDRELLEIND